MRIRIMNWKAAITTVALAITPAITFAQDGGQPGAAGGDRGARPQPGGQGGQGGQRGNWDPAEMQKRRMERIKEQLAAPDDEWKVIEPKLDKVVTAQRDSFAGFGGGGGRRGGPGGGPGGDANADTSPLAVAQRELRTVLETENASAADIETKLNAYRDARTKAQANLEAARKELKEILSAKQEASLVLSGVLE